MSEEVATDTDAYTRELKKAFALAVLRNPGGHPIKTAQDVAVKYKITNPTHLGFISSTFPNDPYVLAEMERIKEEEPEKLLPTATEVALEAWTLARDKSVEAKDRVAAMKVVNELMGYGKTDAPPPSDVQHVMLVPMAASDADWELKAARNQQKLIDATANG